MVTAWYGDRVEELQARLPFHKPPARLCVFDYPEETLKFLNELRRSFLVRDETEGQPEVPIIRRFPNSRRPSRVAGVTDFSGIEWISTSTALVLSAEFDRVRILNGTVLPTIDLDRWHEGVFSKLYEIGFFEVMQLTDKLPDRFVTSEALRTMRIVSGDEAALRDVADSIAELCEFFDDHGLDEDTAMPLRDSLSEAMINARRWAYHPDHNFKYRHVGRWWVTASAERVNRTLTVSIYDQGATIPVSFGGKVRKWPRRLLGFFNKIASQGAEFEFADDGAYIATAVLPGESQTSEEHHGNGLAEMKGLVDECGSGSMRILSRGGLYEYDHGNEPIHFSRRQPIGGTLIEWKLQIPSKKNHD